jgi:hypothetical protein
MDTDGTCNSHGAAEFGNMNRSLTEAVIELALSLGHKVAMRTRRAKVHGKDCGTFYIAKWTPPEIVFRLLRKARRQRQVQRRTTRFRYVVSCSPIAPVPMRCITVDALDGLYLVGSAFIPTHNTEIVLGVARNEHWRSIIFRRVFPSLRAIVDRSREIYNTGGMNALKDRLVLCSMTPTSQTTRGSRLMDISLMR